MSFLLLILLFLCVVKLLYLWIEKNWTESVLTFVQHCSWQWPNPLPSLTAEIKTIKITMTVNKHMMYRFRHVTEYIALPHIRIHFRKKHVCCQGPMSHSPLTWPLWKREFVQHLTPKSCHRETQREKGRWRQDGVDMDIQLRWMS